jgi:hypothetical protein
MIKVCPVGVYKKSEVNSGQTLNIPHLSHNIPQNLWDIALSTHTKPVNRRSFMKNIMISSGIIHITMNLSHVMISELVFLYIFKTP